MIDGYVLLGIVSLLELCIWLLPVWPYRRFVAGLIMAGLVAASALLAVTPTYMSILVLIGTIYRVINLARILKARMNQHYLYRVTLRTSYRIMLLQLTIVVVGGFIAAKQLHNLEAWIVVGFLCCVTGAILLGSTVKHLISSKPPKTSKAYTDKELPTLTVAIPARNETEILEECLQSIIASDYPKLEILVLDDCSQNKRTPEIIRSFAQDGVRFIAGKPPADNWLSKNQAYRQLLDECSGEYILFCGVDARFEPQSLRALVGIMLDKQKSMISVIPRNRAPQPFSQYDSLLVQPMRYAWELSLPRQFFQRPPVLSTSWMISRKALLSAGGFAAVSRAIRPESYFARVCSRHGGYSFIRSNHVIGISSIKAFDAQRETAIRTRYPQLHRRPEQVGLLTVAEFFGMIAPFGLLAWSLTNGTSSILVTLSALACLELVLFYALIVTLTYRRFLLRGLIALPFAVVADIVLMNVSLIKYEFFEVIWKGRNVCIPVMHVIPKLPKV